MILLKPPEIHRLAAKTRQAVGADAGQARCHSDYLETESVQRLQEELLPVIQ